METVSMLVVKGNLRHRIEKLGIEKEDGRRTQQQQKLRDIASQQNFGCDPPERPEWARGAFLYLTPEHAKHIRAAIDEMGLVLQSKHVLVSNQYKELLKEVLEASPPGSGREAFLTRRAGIIEREEVLQLRWKLDGSDELGASPSENTRLDQSVDDREGVAPVYNPSVPRWELLQLSERLMDNREVEEDILEFVTAPVSVQCLQSGMWIKVWEEVCKDHPWLEMREDTHTPMPSSAASSGSVQTPAFCPYCKECDCWAEVEHLQPTNCRKLKEVSEHGELGILLAAILEAANRRRMRRQPVDKPKRIGHGICPKPGCGLPAPGRKSATHCCKRCEAAHLAGKPRLYSNPLDHREIWRKEHGPECTKHTGPVEQDEVNDDGKTEPGQCVPVFPPPFLPPSRPPPVPWPERAVDTSASD